MHVWIASSPHLWNPNHGSKILFSICSWLNLRIGNPGIQRALGFFNFFKNPHVSEHTIQTHVLQSSTVCSPSTFHTY